MAQRELWHRLRVDRGRLGPFDRPAFRIAVGLLCIAGAILLTLYGGRVTNNWNAPFVGWYLFVLVVGLVTLASGLGQRRRQLELEAEMRRARADWHHLRAAVAAAEAEGHNAVRVLLDRGYREFEVRRWILHRLGHTHTVDAHRRTAPFSRDSGAPPAHAVAMPPSRDLLIRTQRLRELFLDDRRGTAALADYWRSEADVAAYDAVLGARIGWKWNAALAECQDRGWQRADGQLVLDFGCGSGIAARRFVHHFGAGEVLLHDRSRTAATFAAKALRAQSPTTPARTVPHVDDLSPDVLLVSHVLGELDADGEAQLRALIDRSRRVVLVEPGSRAIARRLSALRDELLAGWHVTAPCPHAGACPALASTDDWCHFFAPPPPEAFTDGDWVLTTRALGIDSRALPFSFLALAREPAAIAAPANRVLGRPDFGKNVIQVQLCEAAGLRTGQMTKRADAALWRRLKKQPESVRSL